jgi:hypothetical protein
MNHDVNPCPLLCQNQCPVQVYLIDGRATHKLPPAVEHLFKKVYSFRGNKQDLEEVVQQVAVDILPLLGTTGPSADVIGEAMLVTVSAAYKRGRKARDLHNYYEDEGAFGREVDLHGPSLASPEDVLVALDEEADGAARVESYRVFLETPATVRKVRPVARLATYAQAAPELVDEAMIDEALEASRPGRGVGILRSAEHFKTLFMAAVYELARAMEAKPNCKQWPEHIREIAWIFRGRDGEPCPVEGINDNTTQVGWLYQQKCRGEERLQRAAFEYGLLEAA